MRIQLYIRVSKPNPVASGEKISNVALSYFDVKMTPSSWKCQGQISFWLAPFLDLLDQVFTLDEVDKDLGGYVCLRLGLV